MDDRELSRVARTIVWDYRYSDDLDLFVNQDSGFTGHVDQALATLHARGYRFAADAFVRNDQYARVLVQPHEELFFSDLAAIASDLLAVRENSLCHKR